MGRKRLTGLLLVLACAAGLEAQSQVVVRVTAERTSLREAPATDAGVVATIMKGDELDVLDTSGAWYRVRVKSTSREGFVHNLFVEQTSGSPSAAPTPAAQPAAPPTAAATSVPPASSGVARSTAAAAPQPGRQALVAAPDERRMGVGLTSGGQAFGFTPSLRLWTEGKLGFEVNASFFSSGGYSVTALSPSVLVRIGGPKQVGDSVTFLPYWGAGMTYWHYSNDFSSYYCGRVVHCDSSGLGFGGFGGTEVTFAKVPKLAASANVGFFSVPDALGYGGLYFSIAGHWYFK